MWFLCILLFFSVKGSAKLVWFLTPVNLLFLGFVELEPLSTLMVLTVIDELKTLEGSYSEILGLLEWWKELEKIRSFLPSGYWTICSILSDLYSMARTALAKCQFSGNSTSLHLIFLGIMKFVLSSILEWKRVVSPLGLVHRALDPMLVVMLL